MKEITTVEEMERIIEGKGDFFVLFVDEESASQDPEEFWTEVDEFLKEEQQLNGGREYGVYKVDVDRLIELQRFYRVDHRGQTIFFQEGEEQVRSNWVNAEQNKRWLFSILDPEVVMMRLDSVEEVQQKVDHDTAVLLLLPSSSPSPLTNTLRKMGLLNERRSLVFFELLPSSFPSFFLSYPPPLHYSPSLHTLLFILFPSHHHSYLLFPSQGDGEGEGQGGQGGQGEGEGVGWKINGTLVEEVEKMGRWVHKARMDGLHSIGEVSQEKFIEFTGLYDYVVMVPYDDGQRDEVMEVVMKVEQKAVNNHFSFLLLPSSSARIPYPLCLVIDHSSSSHQARENRIMWPDPSSPFSFSSFDLWITSIRTHTFTPFTSIDLPPSPSDVVLVEEPVKEVKYEEYLGVRKGGKGFILTFFYSQDDKSAKIYPLIHAASLLPSFSNVKFYAYNVLANFYSGPPAPALVLSKSKRDLPLIATPYAELEPFVRYLQGEMRRFEHLDEL